MPPVSLRVKSELNNLLNIVKIKGLYIHKNRLCVNYNINGKYVRRTEHNSVREFVWSYVSKPKDAEFLIQLFAEALEKATLRDHSRDQLRDQLRDQSQNQSRGQQENQQKQHLQKNNLPQRLPEKTSSSPLEEQTPQQITGAEDDTIKRGGAPQPDVICFDEFGRSCKVDRAGWTGHVVSIGEKPSPDATLIQIVTKKELKGYTGRDFYDFDKCPLDNQCWMESMSNESLNEFINYVVGTSNFKLWGISKRVNGSHRPSTFGKIIRRKYGDTNIIRVFVDTYASYEKSYLSDMGLIMVHLKEFDGEKAVYSGSKVVRKHSTILDLFDEGTVCFEEIKNITEKSERVRIDSVDMSNSFHEAEIGSGDIIIYAKEGFTAEHIEEYFTNM